MLRTPAGQDEQVTARQPLGGGVVLACSDGEVEDRQTTKVRLTISPFSTSILLGGICSQTCTYLSSCFVMVWERVSSCVCTLSLLQCAREVFDGMSRRGTVASQQMAVESHVHRVSFSACNVICLVDCHVNVNIFLCILFLWCAH